MKALPWALRDPCATPNASEVYFGIVFIKVVSAFLIIYMQIKDIFHVFVSGKQNRQKQNGRGLV